MERFLAAMIVIGTLAMTALILTGCVVGIYFLFSLLP